MRIEVAAVCVLGGALLAPAALARPVEDVTAVAAPSEVVLTIGDAHFTLRPVMRGSFRQGSAADDRWHRADETVRDVTLTKDFAMLDAPVTRGQWAVFVTDTGYVAADAGARTWKDPGFPQTDDHPVVFVSYGDALAFVSWVSAKTGRAARLPTEAEYERATRAGTVTAWYVGDDESAAMTIGAFGTHERFGTTLVKQWVPNAWGFYDLAGNVYEWCSDVYAPYDGVAATDPRNDTAPAATPIRRVLRGGSWQTPPASGRSAARNSSAPESRSADVGFRFVVTEASPVSTPSALSGVPPLGAAKKEAPPPEAPAHDDGSSNDDVALVIVAGALVVPAIFFVVRRLRRKR